MKPETLDFFQQVFEVVKLIPEGRVTSYGSVARYLGAARSSRMVGYAMNASHSHKEYVPAHRVVNRLGLLTGKHHFPTPFDMQEKLELEGITVKNDEIIEFEKHFWDPNIELAL
jgi:methylated-DNA-protein-cysteine methyltransferase-like protein